MTSDRPEGVDRHTVRGAARIGLWIISWPFASVTVSRQSIVVRAMWSTETAWRDAGDRLAIREGPIGRSARVLHGDGRAGEIVFSGSATALDRALRAFDWGG